VDLEKAIEVTKEALIQALAGNNWCVAEDIGKALRMLINTQKSLKGITLRPAEESPPIEKGMNKLFGFRWRKLRRRINENRLFHSKN